MHKYGDLVIYQMGKVQVNALVVQSNPQPDGEHLVILFLDPAVASNSLAGSVIDKAIAKAFPEPLIEGKAYGWKDLPNLTPIAPEGTKLDSEPEAKITFTSSFSGKAHEPQGTTENVGGEPQTDWLKLAAERESKVTNGL